MYAKDQKKFLLFLLEATPIQLKFILNHLSHPQKMSLYEVCYNVLRGSISLTGDEMTTLRKHGSFYRQMAHKKTQKFKTKPIILLLEIVRPTIEAL